VLNSTASPNLQIKVLSDAVALFGPLDPEQPSDVDIRHFRGGSFSVNITDPDGPWFEWCDGEIIRVGSIKEFQPIHNEFQAKGKGGDLRAVLWEWDRRGRARMENEAAAIICEILLERRVPQQDKYGNRRLHVGWAEIDVEPDNTTEELADLAIETLNEELEDFGIDLPRFDPGRLFTEEEIARARASLPQPEEPATNPPDPDPAPNETTDDSEAVPTTDRPAFPEPDSNQLEIFIDAAFRHCNLSGVVSLRAFFEDGGSKPFRITNISLKGGLKFLIEAAVDDARRAANNPKPVVFCPPIATFAPDAKGRAREQDLFEAPAFSVELDQNPRAALATLERLLGFATLVVRSGGEWVNPETGEVEDKLHAHWRLKEPARGEGIIKLKQLRKLATALVGGDPSNIPACHPIRWPGSWQRKAKPRLCEIVSTDHLDNELDLDVALAALEAVIPPPPKGNDEEVQESQQGEILDWNVAFGKVITGKEFHPVLTPLASSFAARGTPETVTVRVLRALMVNTQTTDPARIARRDTELAKLKDTVRSGYEKFAPKGGALFDPWQEFIAPPFPLDILPGAAHDFVATKSTAMGADPAALAMAQLTAFSGAIHHKFRVKMMRNSDWYEHVRLWTLLFGRSSWLKSPIMEAMLRPIRRAQADLQRDYKARMRTWKAQHKGKNSDGLGGEHEEPHPPERYIVGDTTTEMLGEIMARSERGLLAEHDELAGWIGRMERYHTAGKGASADRAFYLRCWNGGPYTIDRKSSGEILVPNASLSIIGGIQPQRMDELHSLTSDGLLQRFAITLMRAPEEPQDIDCTEATNAYNALVHELLQLPPQRFYLTNSAADAMAELQHHLHSLERVGAALTEAFEGHIGKLKAYAGVLTIILHLITHRAEAVKLTAIGRPSVEKAARLIKEFLLPHAHEFYNRSESEGERLRRLASYVLTCGKDRLRLADFTTNVRDCRGKKVLEINQQVSPLVAGDWLIPVEQSPVCRGWTVNRSAINQQFAARMASERESKIAIAQLLGARRRPD